MADNFLLITSVLLLKGGKRGGLGDRANLKRVKWESEFLAHVFHCDKSMLVINFTSMRSGLLLATFQIFFNFSHVPPTSLINKM